MARRGVPEGPVNWYLKEWMDFLGVRQTDMIKRTGWAKATASQLYNGTQDYSPKVVNEAATALNLMPFELLMQPELAVSIRRLRADPRLLANSERAAEVVRMPRQAPSNDVRTPRKK
jgi:transcriptional regulator with XRE-family HTH domain